MAGRKRIRGWFARVILGMMMTVVAFVVEKQLLRALKRSSGKSKALRDLGTPPPERVATSAGEPGDLSSSSPEDQVEDQGRRE